MVSLTETMLAVVAVTLTDYDFVTATGKAKTSKGQIDRQRKVSHL